MLVDLKARNNPKIIQNLDKTIHTRLLCSHNTWSVVRIMAKNLLEITLRKENTFDKTSSNYVFNRNVQCSRNNNENIRS